MNVVSFQLIESILQQPLGLIEAVDLLPLDSKLIDQM